MYVRNHNSVPDFDEDFEEEFELEVGMTKGNFKSFTLEQLRKMESVEVTTAISCAGNRRSHTRKVYP